MAIQWDPHSAELSGWEQGVINGQHCNLKFAFIFRHGISVTIRDRDDLHMGQTVRMKIRRRAAFNPNFSSQHNAEEVFVTSRPPSLLDVKGLFLKALMDPSIDRQGRSLFYDRYIGNAFDTDHKVPDHISRQEKTIVVDLLAKKCEDDQTKSYLKIVHYYGQYKGNDIRDESVGTRTRDSHEALIRRVSGSYYYALSPGKTEELKIRKELLVAHENWLGKWISFEETHRMSDGSIELLKPKLSSVQHSGIAVNGDIVNVRLDCEPLRMENGVQIYTTKGAGNMVDTFHILDTSERNFPCSLWLEPELNHPSCLWRVSREKESPDVSTNKQSSRYEGCILTANSETCWIYCKDVLVDVIADIDLIKDIKDPIGKWVSFPEPIKTGSKAQIRGQIALLENDLINTRVRHNVPELEVACTHYGQNESDGSQVLCSEEVGDVVVIGEPIIRRIGHIQLPSKLWVVKHKEREGQYRSRWKLSYENNFNSFRPLTNTSLDHIGCITTVMGDVFFASCKDFERDLLGGIELIKNLKDPLGKWITFPPPTGLPSKLRIRGPVDPLQEPLVKTRVAANIVELEVKLISQEGNESDGKNAFWTDELGTVVDCDNKLDRLSLPVTVWVIEHRNELHRSRWMIRSISPTALLSEPNETTRFKGIIVNEKDGLCWILCTQLPRNTILQKNLIGNTTKVLGKWVEFSIIESSRQGYVCADDPVLLEEDVYPTRLYNQTPEICVEIYSLARQDHEGMVFEGEAGTVLDSMHIFSKNVSYPFKCWITYVKDKAGMPRWKISPNNNLREIFSKPPNHLQRAEPEVQRTEDRFEDVEWLYDSDEEQPENEPTPTVTHYEQQRTQCNRTVMSSEGRRSAPIAQSNPMTRQSTPQYLVTKRDSIDTVSIRSSPFGRKAGKEDLSYDQKSLSSLCEDILEDPDLVNAFQQMNPGLFNAFERATSHARHSIS